MNLPEKNKDKQSGIKGGVAVGRQKICLSISESQCLNTRILGA